MWPEHASRPVTRSTWVPLLACLSVALLTAGSCGDDSSSSSSDNGAGQPTPPLWNDQSTTATGGTGDTPLLWNDPNTANTQFGIIDPTDTRTYTYPDIYILGNKHPLMTDVTARDFPVIVTQEQRLTDLLIEWRILEYERLIGMRRTDVGFPRAAFLAEYADLRRNARAHCKHFAVWHTTVAFALVNPEGDNIINNGITITRVEPSNAAVGATNAAGRLPYSMIDVDAAGQLIQSGPTYGIPDRVFTQWSTNNGNFIRRTNWTHLGVGYWAGTGSSDLHYWNAVYAENPRALFTTPAIPIIFF
jgi:hypothetical protein